MWRWTFAGVIVLFSFTAQSKTCCICQIGAEPAYQRGFFEKGCEMWLQEQPQCDSSAITDLNPYHSQIKESLLPVESCEGGQVLLGYVGHWDSALRSYAYFQRVIAPTMNKYKVDMYWDNTACSGLDNPKQFVGLYTNEKSFYMTMRKIKEDSYKSRLEISQRFKTPPPEKPVLEEIPHAFAGKFEYKANQVRSIGMWDRFAGASNANFWAIANLTEGKVIYPACKDFEGTACSYAFQPQDQGVCQNPDQSLKKLKCCYSSVWSNPSECS